MQVPNNAEATTESHPDVEATEVVVEQERRNWAATKVGKIVATAIVALEVLPTNELVRYGAAAAAQATLGDPAITAAVFGGSTLIVEAGGSIVTADLLDAGVGQKQISWVRGKKDKYFGADAKTNLPIESAIAMVAGAPAATIVKHIQDSERTRSQNRLYGIWMSLGTSAVLGADAYAVSAGISHPSPETIGGAVFGVGVVYGGYKWIKSRFNKRKNSQGVEDA